MKKYKYAKIKGENIYIILNWNDDKIIQYTTDIEAAQEAIDALNKAEELFRLDELPFT